MDWMTFLIITGTLFTIALVCVLATRRAKSDRLAIITVLKGRKDSMGCGDIALELRKYGLNLSFITIYVACSRLAATGHVLQIEEVDGTRRFLIA